MTIPQHLAIIMDGNGRWAERQGLPRLAGHQKGVEAVREITRASVKRGVRHLTLFAFSSENWQRPQEEVQALMTLLTSFLAQELASLQENGVRLSVIGELDRLTPAARESLAQACQMTSNNDAMELILALSYGSRNEMVRGMRKMAAKVADGELSVDQIDEQHFSAALDTADRPDPDLLIRTSGEQRISNFLLWQIAYAELYFTDVLWPDFDTHQLDLALEDFAQRQRRFGLTGAQIKPVF
ncbi:MAG: isoprenyl transferase [Desulfuromonas sp.]|nr:MAG: isoprenyl transferase [Desulfuromonas sp.]